MRLRLFFAAAAIGIALVGVAVFRLVSSAGSSPVPGDIKSLVDFPIYYPDSHKLPDGFSLDTTSFRMAQSGVMIYSVQSKNGPLIISEEQTPATNIIESFTNSYIPLHNDITTDLGKAAIGSAGQGKQQQTIVSLPITKGPWLIITGPSKTSQSDLRRVLDSLVQD